MQDELYGCAGHLLSERLPQETFHITLHDLCSGEDEESVRWNIEEHGKKISQIMEDVRQKGLIQLRAVGIVSMVASSIVVLFEPKTESDHEMMQTVYSAFDAIQPLPYPLTLHCTLAYYKPSSYSPEQWNCIFRKITELNQKEMNDAVLDCAALEYQHFFSMKDYFNVEA